MHVPKLQAAARPISARKRHQTAMGADTVLHHDSYRGDVAVQLTLNLSPNFDNSVLVFQAIGIGSASNRPIGQSSKNMQRSNLPAIGGHCSDKDSSVCVSASNPTRGSSCSELAGHGAALWSTSFATPQPDLPPAETSALLGHATPIFKLQGAAGDARAAGPSPFLGPSLGRHRRQHSRAGPVRSQPGAPRCTATIIPALELSFQGETRQGAPVPRMQSWRHQAQRPPAARGCTSGVDRQERQESLEILSEVVGVILGLI